MHTVRRVFSLVNLSFATLICRAPAIKPKRVKEKVLSSLRYQPGHRGMIGKAGGETADKATQVQIRVAGRTAVTVHAVPSPWLSEVDSD